MSEKLSTVLGRVTRY